VLQSHVNTRTRHLYQYTDRGRDAPIASPFLSHMPYQSLYHPPDARHSIKGGAKMSTHR
jgi:hypothetical protein